MHDHHPSYYTPPPIADPVGYMRMVRKNGRRELVRARNEARAALPESRKAARAAAAEYERLGPGNAYERSARAVDGATPLQFAAWNNSNPSVIKALIEGGADPAARDEDGKISFDYAEDNEALKGTDAYWLLNDARFE